MELTLWRIKQWKQMPCFIHTLQLAVEVVLKLPEVSHALARCRHLVAYFNRSVNLFIEEKNRWISDVSTRWNSAYYTAECLLSQQQPLCATLLELYKGLCIYQLTGIGKFSYITYGHIYILHVYE